MTIPKIIETLNLIAETKYSPKYVLNGTKSLRLASRYLKLLPLRENGTIDKIKLKELKEGAKDDQY